jgi:cellulose biosynthesis protein BcsQ
VREQLNPGLSIYGVLLTMVDRGGSKSHAQRVVATVRHSLKNQVPVFETEIAQDVAFKESAEAGISIIDYQSRGKAAEMYRGLAREVARAAGDLSVAAVAAEKRGLFTDALRLFRGRPASGAAEARVA